MLRHHAVNVFLRIYALYNRDKRIIYSAVTFGVVALALGSVCN